MKYYLPIMDGRPVAWDGEQFAFCDDLSYWQDPPHKAKLYRSLPALKKRIEQSKQFRTKQGWECGRYGWVQVSLAGLSVYT